MPARKPEPHQPENWLIGPNRWKLVKRPAGTDVIGLLQSQLDYGPTLLGDETDRRSPRAFLRMVAHASFALVAPNHVDWEVKKAYGSKPQIIARFALAGVSYGLRVTDPEFERRLGHLDEGSYLISSASDSRVSDRFLLTISLGEEYLGYHYKLVAGVIQMP
ncbi:MAG: hypothetical protein M0T85_03730, partial [Dehalococcoidales bacterium]|nr:hypothetical protein [Dehalococcoidales bacterium]